MFHVGTGVFAKTGVVPEDLIGCVFSFSNCLLWLVRTVGCSGIHFRRVLSGKEVLFGQKMLCQMIGMTVVC